MQPQTAPALKPFEDHGHAHVHHAKICTGAYFIGTLTYFCKFRTNFYGCNCVYSKPIVNKRFRTMMHKKGMGRHSMSC